MRTASRPNLPRPALLKPGDRLPDVRLQWVDGPLLPLVRFRQRRNLVIVLLGPEVSAPGQALLEELARARPAIQAEAAELLAVTTATPQQAGELTRRLGLPLLTDPDGTLHRAALGPEISGERMPSVLVVDRYGEIYAVLRPDPAPPQVADILEWLRFIELQCPE